MAILWHLAEDHSTEFFTLTEHDTTITLSGTVILMLENTPTRIQYRVTCDPQWRTQTVNIQQTHGEATHEINLTVDENGVWRKDGEIISAVEGVTDVDLEITPATNTLPIRRLNLAVGESAMMDAAWVRFPSLNVERLQQRYTRLAENRYEYHNPASGFTAELEVDAHGVVINYGELWRRITAGGWRSLDY